MIHRRFLSPDQRDGCGSNVLGYDGCGKLAMGIPLANLLS